MRNIGIFAHVDAGKTTLSEQLLLLGGAIRKAGSVDCGTAHTDSLPVEQRRGISVKASCVRLSWRGETINLIDTPGHTDFSAEIERSVWALDGAIIVVCGVEGVQPQTELLFETLREQGLPVFFFINKVDRDTADARKTAAQIRRRLSGKAVLLSDQTMLLETLCECDDRMMEAYLDGQTPDRAEISSALSKYAQAGEVFPILEGSALKGNGILDVLDGIIDFLPPPDVSMTVLSGVAFASEQDRLLGKGMWVRMFGGRLFSRDQITLPGRTDPVTGEAVPVQSKITQIRAVDGSDTGILRAGEIGVIYGVSDMIVGHILGASEDLPRKVRPGSLRTPLTTVKVVSDDPSKQTSLAAACRALADEDPLLSARFVSATGELNIDAMGAIQLEILEETLKSRFGLTAKFTDPTVIYRETIAREAVGFCAYTMPKPCWAILKFELRPSRRGSGVSFHSIVPGREILPRYQHQVEQAIPLALSQGRLGWQVTDIDITLVGGSHHQFHTHPLDFIVATPWAIQDGLRAAGSVLLEPILEMRLRVPSEHTGRIISDVNAMRGEVLHVEAYEDGSAMTALVPVSESLDYPARLAMTTGGRGGMSVSLHSYRECPLELGHTATRRKVDPLDTSKYILAARSALEGGIFDL
ncbi:MAG: TetM/TetW/TetO/TetS family tetracycline resistance ribosomal protection protein [Clostridiales bacterium]|nr:TetM/TetW/TetO/TetS family tetracycline resistance ribosomal protection protein [Clostridiales bacterium]